MKTNKDSTMPPAGVNMDLIRQAIARRMQGGGGTPAVDQMSQPGGATPTGGPNTPRPAMPQPPQQAPGAGSVAAQPSPAGSNPAAGVAKAASAVNSPQFDDDTRLTAKALVAKLIKVL